ncbi:translocase of outer mitochondrial membrane, partial [Rhizophlyctis rosea]
MSAPAATPGFSLSGLFGLDSLRQRLNLQNPGGWEGLHREAKTVHTTNFLFDGAKFDLTSILTPNFQVLHSLSWGSQSYPPSYQFGSVFADGVTMLHGQVDHDGGLQARAHYNWAAARAKAAAPAQSAASLANPTADPNAPHPALLDAKNNSTTKLTAHVTTSGGQSMLQVEHDHHGADYTLNAKAVNPNPIDASPSWSTSKAPAATGIYQVAYLQSISRSVAVGGEFVYQRPTPDLE